MTDLDARLQQCFAAVFPALAPEQASAANVENVAQWDSLAQVTLLAVIQQEFDVRIDDEEAEGLTSFDAWRVRLQQ